MHSEDLEHCSFGNTVEPHYSNMTTFGPWKTGRINGVVVLKGFFK